MSAIVEDAHMIVPIDAIDIIPMNIPILDTPGMKGFGRNVHSIVVRIWTDGVSGLGYCFDFRPGFARAMGEVIKELAPDLVGKDANQIRARWQQCFYALRFLGQHHGIGLAALSAIDTALWDAMGHRLNVPLHHLWGAARNAIPTYATGGLPHMSAEQVADIALEYQSMGYKALKTRVGVNEDWRVDVRRIATIRERVGENFEIFVDAHMEYERHAAVEAGRGFYELSVPWFEDPLPPTDIEGYTWLRRVTKVPIVHGENVYARAGMLEILRAGAADILMVDSMHCGGPTEMRDIAALSAAHHVPISTHGFHPFAPHFLAATDNPSLLEYQDGIVVFDDEILQDEGLVTLSDRPGFGVSLSDERIARYRADF